MFVTFFIRKLRVSLVFHGEISLDEPILPIEPPLVTVSNHAHTRDVVLHTLCEAVLPLRTGELVLGKLAACTWRGAKFSPFGILLRLKASHAFVGEGKQTDLANLRQAYSHSRVGCQIQPEGAVWSRERHQEAIAYAEANGLPFFKHLLLPRIGAFKTALEVFRPKYVWDWTIAYRKTQEGHATEYLTSFLDLCRWSTSPETLHVLLRRLDAPSDTKDESVKKWLMECWQEKDRLIEGFQREGEFNGPQTPIVIDWPWEFIWRKSLVALLIFFVLPAALVFCFI